MGASKMSERERVRRAAQSRRDRERNESYTVAEWCALRRLSKAMLYKLFSEGLGPATYRVGKRRYVSAKSDAAWLAAREAEAREAEAA
jgi:AraC-like DNA-binding protein